MAIALQNFPLVPQTTTAMCHEKRWHVEYEEPEGYMYVVNKVTVCP